jgi:group II intron reverse transcriptase/maturase
MSRQLELPLEGRSEAPSDERSAEAPLATHANESSGTSDLMERVCERANLQAALKRVRKNKGSAGIDGMTVEELPEHLKTHWPALREQLLAGTYHPSKVRRCTIPKSDGGIRELGIPTVVDRFIQQAISQVLGPRFDRTFSQHSYGFRPGRSAHDAIVQAQRYVVDGRRVVVDVDLERFFDRVNHDVLMGRLAKRIEDKRLLGLIRRYLESGVMVNGVAMERHEGTPQGGPLSPLLANVLLDEVDKQLEKRGHAFVRYADDCNVYVRTRRAAERVMNALRSLYASIRLRVNETKSAIDDVENRKFLGYSMYWVKREPRPRLCVAPKALKAMKDRVREITRRSRGQSMKRVAEDLRTYLVGWKNYFRLADMQRIFGRLDKWIRHRLRAVQLKHWKRGPTMYRELRALGVSQRVATIASTDGRPSWGKAHGWINLALPNSYFDELGVPRLAA